MSTTSSQTQQLSQLAAIMYPEATNGGDQNAVMFNLNTGAIERGPISLDFSPMFCCLYQNPSTSVISLEIKPSVTPLLSLGANMKIYCVKGKNTNPESNFISAHRDMFVKLKEGLIQYERMLQTQSQQSTNGLKMPPSAGSSQFAGSTGQTPSVGMGFGNQTATDFRPATSTSSPFASASASTANLFTSGSSSTFPASSSTSAFGSSSNTSTPAALSSSSSSSLFTSGSSFGQQQATSAPAPAPSNFSSGLFQNVPSSTVNPPNPMMNPSNSLFTGGSSNSMTTSFGAVAAPVPSTNTMFATAPVNTFQGQTSNSQKIVNYFTQKKFSDAEIARIIIGMLESSFGGNTRAAKIFPLKAPTDKSKTNPTLSDLRTPVSMCFRRLPTSIDDINNCFAADNTGGKDDVGIMYRFDASSPIFKATGFANIGDIMRGFFEVMFSRVSIASLTPYLTRHLNVSSQMPSAASVFNPSGSTGTFSAFSNTVAQPAPQPLTSHPFATNSNFGSTPTPLVSISQPPVQTGPVFAISLFDNLKELDHHEHFYDDVSACVLRTNDGDTFDIGAIIPVDQYVGCKKITSGGKVHDKGMCLLHGSQAQGKFGFNFNGRIQGIDAAEYHFRVTGKKIQSTREGWYAKLLMEQFFNKINEERADLRASFHGLGMYGRYQVTLKLNGVSVGEALTHMTYQGRPVAVAGYNGEHKSKFSEQFESFDFDALTNDPNEIANMNATVDQDLPRFISFFADYKKNVDGKIVQSVSSSSNIFSSNAGPFGLTSTPSQIAPTNATLFGNSSAAALFSGSSAAAPASAPAPAPANPFGNAALFSSSSAPVPAPAPANPFGNAALFSGSSATAPASAPANPFGNAALFSSSSVQAPSPAPAPAANLFGNSSSNATLFSSFSAQVPAPSPAPASNPFGANSVSNTSSFGLSSAPSINLPFGVAAKFDPFAPASVQTTAPEPAQVSQFIIQPTTTSFGGSSSSLFSGSSLSQPNVPLVYDRQEDDIDENGNLLTSVEDEDHDDDDSENENFAVLDDEEPELVQNQQEDEDYDEVIPGENVF